MLIAGLLSLLAFSLAQAHAAPPRSPGERPAVRDGKPVRDKTPLMKYVRKAVFYAPNRVIDFVDVWRFNVGVGLGAGFNIRPTKSLQFGLAAYDSVRVGLRGRRWPPYWHEWSLEGGFDGMYEELGETERGFYEFGGTIHFLIVGLDAAFDIEEALDFGFGVFLADPADDDYR